MIDRASALAGFLLAETGSVLGVWVGRMSYREQRMLLGRVLGKGVIRINGSTERVTHTRKVCFGTDAETVTVKWSDLSSV